MKKGRFYVKAFAHLVLVSILLSFTSETFANWGMEVGRANEGDLTELIQQQVVMKRAQNRISDAVSRPIIAERKLALLGKSSGNAANILDQVFDWWKKDVMEPANAIARNPAASCADAANSGSNLIGMMRQIQVLGMELSDARDAELQSMLDTIVANGLERCRDEAQDECVATGRIKQIVNTALTEARNAALVGRDVDLEAWAKDTLKECATYDLHFVSTTNVTVGYTVDSVMDGTIKLKFVEDGGPVFGMTLKGQTEGSNNPFLISVKCQRMGTLTLTCSPGATPTAYEAKVVDLDLEHPDFYVTPDGVSTKRTTGENKLVLEFRAGLFNVQMVVNDPRAPNINIPFPIGPEFWEAHYKDRLEQTTTVKFENNKRGVQPTVFDFIYADQNTIKATKATDSTHFELVHKITDEAMKKLYPPKKSDDKPKKPLKPVTSVRPT